MTIITQSGNTVDVSGLRMTGTSIIGMNLECSENVLLGNYDNGTAVKIFCEMTAVDWSGKASIYVMPK